MPPLNAVIRPDTFKGSHGFFLNSPDFLPLTTGGDIDIDY